MTTVVIEQPARDISVATSSDTESREDTVLPANDVRLVGLGAAGHLLGMQIADLGPVGVRRAKADLVHCPICPGH